MRTGQGNASLAAECGKSPCRLWRQLQEGLLSAQPQAVAMPDAPRPPRPLRGARPADGAHPQRLQPCKAAKSTAQQPPASGPGGCTSGCVAWSSQP